MLNKFHKVIALAFSEYIIFAFCYFMYNNYGLDASIMLTGTSLMDLSVLYVFLITSWWGLVGFKS